MHTSFASSATLTSTRQGSHLRVEVSGTVEGAGAVAHVGFAAAQWHAVVPRLLKPAGVLPVQVVGDAATMELYVVYGDFIRGRGVIY